MPLDIGCYTEFVLVAGENHEATCGVGNNGTLCWLQMSLCLIFAVNSSARLDMATHGDQRYWPLLSKHSEEWIFAEVWRIISKYKNTKVCNQLQSVLCVHRAFVHTSPWHSVPDLHSLHSQEFLPTNINQSKLPVIHYISNNYSIVQILYQPLICNSIHKSWKNARMTHMIFKTCLMSILWQCRSMCNSCVPSWFVKKRMNYTHFNTATVYSSNKF